MKEYAIIIGLTVLSLLLAMKGCDAPFQSSEVYFQMDSNTAKMNEALTKLEASANKLSIEVAKLEGAVNRVVQ